MKKSLIGIFLTVLLIAALLPGAAFAAAETADGEWDGFSVVCPKLVDQVYQIGTAQELAWFQEGVHEMDKDAVLTADIDFQNHEMMPLDMGRKVKFDGQGHRIKNVNVYVWRGYPYSSMGLFSSVNGTVSNLADVTGRVRVSYTVGRSVGSLAGSLLENGVIENCKSSVTLSFGRMTDDPCIGGIAGEGRGGKIHDCEFAGSIDLADMSYLGEGRQQTACVGGIVGYVVATSESKTSVYGCVSKGSITGGHSVDRIGGLVGYLGKGDVSVSYHAGTISSAGAVGGLAGIGTGDGTLSNLYHRGTLSGGSQGGISANTGAMNINHCYYLSAEAQGDGCSVTATQMKSAEFLTQLNEGAAGETKFAAGLEFPILSWENTAIDTAQIDGTGDAGSKLTAIAKGGSRIVSNGLSYQWQLSAEQESGFADLKGETKNTITLKDEQVGQYVRVVITDGKGAEAASSAIKVLSSDLRKVEAAHSSLQLAQGPELWSAKTIVLPTASKNGCGIQWSSSKPDVITAQGQVSLPDTDQSVTLTATISAGDQQQEKSFSFTVKGKNTIKAKMEKDFTEKCTAAAFLYADGSGAVDTKAVTGNFLVPAAGDLKLEGAENYTIRAVSLDEEVMTVKGNTVYVKRPQAVAKVALLKCVLSLNGTDLAVSKEFALKVQSQQLAAPASMKAAAAGYNKVKVRWSAVSGAEGYELYCAASKKSGVYRKLKTTAETGHTDSSLKTGTAYYYKVRAYITVGGKPIYSEWSSTASAKPELKAPTGIKAKGAKKSAKLSWKKVTGASGYMVYQAAKKKGTYKKAAVIKKGKTAKYTSRKLKKGKTYYYKVRAYRIVSGKKVYGKWSKAVKAKAK